MKTININGVKFTKEELEEKLKEFDKPKWEFKEYDDGSIRLFKNEAFERWVWDTGSSYQFNLSRLIYSIAESMGYLATKEQILDESKEKYHLRLDLQNKKMFWNYENLAASNSAIIDTDKHAIKIRDLINGFQPLLNRIFGVDDEKEEEIDKREKKWQ